MVAGDRRLCARASEGEAACRGVADALDSAPAANAPTTPASDLANPLRFRVIVLSPCRIVFVAVWRHVRSRHSGIVRTIVPFAVPSEAVMPLGPVTWKS